MKKIIILLFISFTVLLANVGKITSTKGEVYVSRGADNISAKSGFVLELNDKVVTKGKSKALVLFNDNTTITVGKNSSLSVNEFVIDTKTPSNNKAKFGFGKGVFRTITGKIGKINPKGFQIKTKSASIGIRGTIFKVEVTPKNLVVDVESGATWVLPQGQSIPTDVPMGSVLVYDDEKATLEVVPKAQYEEQKAAQEEQQKEEENDNQNNQNNQDDENNNGNDGQKPTNDDPDNNPQNPDNAPENPDDGVPPVEDPDIGPIPRNPPDVLTPDVNNVKTNTAPSAKISTISVLEDQSSIIRILALDNEGDTLSFSISGNPTFGTATINSNTGEVIYTPNSNYYGAESFKVTISDGSLTYTLPINFTITSVNDIPTINLSSTSITTDQDTSSSVTLIVNDIEDGLSGVNVVYSANHGTVTSTNGVLIYTPSSGYSGTDTITITVTDTDGGTTSQTIQVTVNSTSTDVIALSPSGEIISLTNVTKQTLCANSTDCDHYSSYVDYGYLINSSGVATGTYVNGTTTPNSVISSYISAAQTATYNGGIAVFNNGNQVGGNISLDMNFGTKSFTGDINIDNGNWAATISSGSINSYGFSSSNISGSGESHTVTSGSLSGKYYGPNADAAGGSFSLNSSNGTVNGTFGAKKQ